MDEHELIAFLTENLSMTVVTESIYTGDRNGQMYRDCHTVKLRLCGETISEVTL